MSVMSQVVKYDNNLYQILISKWLLDTEADFQVMTMVEWRRLGEPMLTETKVKLTTASGEDLGALGTVKVRGCLKGQRVDFEAVVATKAQKCLLSGVKLRENGYQLTLSSSGSYIEKRGTKMNLTVSETW